MYMDNKIRAALEYAAKDIAPKENMLSDITERYEKECLKMKKIKPVRVLAVCAVMCAAISGIAIGAGKIASTESHSSHYEDINHYPTLDELKNIIDYTPVYPKKLGDHEFESCVPVHSTERDENKNAVRDYTGMNFSYKTENGFLNLDTKPGSVTDTEGSESVDYNGVTLYYRSDVYKFVPPDYKLTEEDKELQEKGELVISYGSKDIEINTMLSVVWNKDGVGYCLIASDPAEDKDEFIALAKQAVDGE